MPTEYHRAFLLDPSITFVNHGSFGACPREVLAHQSALRDRLEREPVRFYTDYAPPRLDAERESMAALFRAQPEDLVFVPNATEGTNTILASLAFEPDDEILTTNHVYPAARHAAEHYASRAGASVTLAEVPFPIASPEQVTDAVLSAITPRTRFVILDHVTSPTGLVFPLERLIPLLRARGIPVLIDGAHAPGMIPLDLTALGADYYVGNLHKWLCTPKGCAVLHIRRDRQDGIHPLSISHGHRSKRARPRLWEEFDWTGTRDLTAWLSATKALEVLSAMHPEGLDGLQRRNRALALEARAILCAALDIDPPAPDSMLASLVTVPLPESPERHRDVSPEPLGAALYTRHQIEVPVFPWPHFPRRLLRIACQIYVDRGDVERVSSALRVELAAEDAR